MQRLITPNTGKLQPETAGGFGVCVDSLEPVSSPELVNSPAPYWYCYWFSHGVPLADA